MNERLRKRLEALNRAPLTEAQNSASVPTNRHRSPPPARSAKIPSIEQLLAGAKEVTNDAGDYLLIDIPLERLWPTGEQLCSARRQFLSQTLAAEQTSSDASASFHPEFVRLISATKERTLYFDLETCGFAGAALFLIGVLIGTEQGHTIRLLLAANYAQEKAVLAAFWELLSSTEVLVSFNGKSFDWPMILDRSQRFLIFRETPPAAPLHIDILHHARRKWKRLLPDCKLKTLESRICGRVRKDDIPGEQIPASYAEFVRTGNQREMESILLHNAIDLVSLLDLTMRLAS